MPTFLINHTTHYEYSAAVRLEPHRVQLCPQGGAGILIHEHELRCTPAPAGQRLFRKTNGELVHALWYSGSVRSASIECVSTVEVSECNPFNFLVHPLDCAYLPFKYPESDASALGNYCDTAAVAPAVAQFANRVVQASGGQTVTSLLGLCTKISREFHFQRREFGAPYAPEETIGLKVGTGRDFAVLFIAAARSLGLAARFVSGYVLDALCALRGELHAWAEVYIPGAGWVGFDPTLGIAAGASHVALATGVRPDEAAPVVGHFRGNAESRVRYEVIVDCLDTGLDLA